MHYFFNLNDDLDKKENINPNDNLTKQYTGNE
jgi:hypothetical protein